MRPWRIREQSVWMYGENAGMGRHNGRWDSMLWDCSDSIGLEKNSRLDSDNSNSAKDTTEITVSPEITSRHVRMSYYSQYWTFCTTSPWCNDINLKGASTKLNSDSNWQEVLKLRRMEMTKNLPYWWWNAGCFLHKVVCGLSLDRCQLCDHTLMSWQKWLPHFSSTPLPNPPITPSRPEPQWNQSKCAMTMWQDKHCGSVPSASNLILWRGKLLDERGALVGVRPVRWKLDGIFQMGRLTISTSVSAVAWILELTAMIIPWSKTCSHEADNGWAYLDHYMKRPHQPGLVDGLEVVMISGVRGNILL